MNTFLACFLACVAWFLVRGAIAITIIRPLTDRAMRKMVARVTGRSGPVSAARVRPLDCIKGEHIACGDPNCARRPHCIICDQTIDG